MKINRVPSYQTSDGQLHSSHAVALTHEAKINVRAMIQSRANIIGNGGAMNASQVADFVIGRSEEMATLLREYRDKMRRATQAETKGGA